MSHLNSDVMAENANVPPKDINLSPVEEHYLKKILIKHQITDELNSLSPEYNDTSGLRRFGPPFVPADPQLLLQNPDNGTLDQIISISELSIDIFRHQFPLLRFIFENYVVNFPFIKIHLNKLGFTSKDQSNFWLKIQILFELFKSKKISNSNDRGSTSKRKMIQYKFQGLFLMLFNSSIYCKQDFEYFELDKERRGAYKKLGKFVDLAEAEAEAENLQDNHRKDQLNKLKFENDNKVLLNMNLSPQKLLKYLDSIDDDEYINGYYINVVGVTAESEVNTSFWSGAKQSLYYTFIIHVKKPNQPGWFIKRRYSDFSKLYKDLKASYPGHNLPELPSKDKNVVAMHLDDDPSIDAKLGDDLNQISNFYSGLNEVDEDHLNELFEHADRNNDSTKVEAKISSNGSGSGILKLPKPPKLGSAFLKSSSKKSTTQPDYKGKSTTQIEKSFFHSFKMVSSTSSSSANVKSHTRSGSYNSQTSVDSTQSIKSCETVDTFHSANSGQTPVMMVKDNKMTFPRETLRQSLRGFLKYLLYVKPVADSVELIEFLNDFENQVILKENEIKDIQHRVNIDHLRTLQHYKFQSALVGVVKILEQDVESLKIRIYDEGFGYVFNRIKINKTLRELCGYSNEKLQGATWLQNANLIGSINDKKLNDEQLDYINNNIDDEHAPLRGLVRIILLEIASTQYELLIGSDSSLGTLKTIKRLNSVFPYKLVAGVLRFTNPLMMVKRMIDVFTYQMPSVSGSMSSGFSAINSGIEGMIQGLGFGKRKETIGINPPKHKSGKSLLQLLFSGVIGEDLRKLEKDLLGVSESLKCREQGSDIIDRIDKYFESSDDIVLHVKGISKQLGLDIPTAIMLPNNGMRNCHDLNAKTIADILEGYAQVSRMGERKKEERQDVVGKKSATRIKEKEANSPYKLAKRYFYLKLRKFDKESIIEMWNEPELMNVIKEVFSLFLSPLIELFKKAEVYKYVPIFAKYMGELIELCENYNQDYGAFGRSDVVGSLVGLGEKYSEYVYQFIRDMYLNDIENESRNGKLFEGIVEWLNGVVSFLKFVKKGRPDLLIDLNEMLKNMELSDQEKQKLVKEIKGIVERASKKRKVLEEMTTNEELKKEALEKEREHDWMRMGRDRKVDNNWDAIHNRIFRVGEIVGAGGELGEMDIYEGIEDVEDIETDSDTDTDTDADTDVGTDNKKVGKQAIKLKNCRWDVKQFIDSYNSRDWTTVNTISDTDAYNGAVTGEYWKQGTGRELRSRFKSELENVLQSFK